MSVRRAQPRDLDALATVMVESWDGVYRGLMPDEVIDGVTYERRRGQFERYFAGSDDRILMVVEHGGVVGLLLGGGVRDEDLDPTRVGEIMSIYVTPGHWGHGHGRHLMVAGLGEFRRLGFDEAALWVLDTNQRARRFYEMGGWTTDGAVKVDESFGSPLSEVRYRIELTGHQT